MSAPAHRSRLSRMSRGRRIAVYTGAGFASVLLLLLVAALVVTNTDWGREQVRRFMVDQLARNTAGEIRIGRVEGNLLRRITLVDVSIVDEQRRPFLRADTISTRFGLRALLRQRLALTDVRLVSAEVVLDRPPGEQWNHVRIFRIDPPEVVAPHRTGWGDWVALTDVVIVDSRITVRTEWTPGDDLTPAERERVLREALAGEKRENVVAVNGGYQNIMDFRELNAFLPHIIPAHPDSAGIPIEVARFSGIVQPFRPPPGIVHDLSGKFRLAADTLHFSNIAARLPDSELTAAGAYALHSGDLDLRMRFDDLAFADLRWLYPPLPEEGGGAGLLHLEMRRLATHIVGEELDLRVGAATLQGRIDVTTGDTVRIGSTDVEFQRVGTGLLLDILGVRFPRAGELNGRLAVVGPPSALRIDGDVLFDDAAGADSRIIAVGELGVEPDLRFRDMRLRFEPVQSALVRAFIPQFPVTGTITGFANLTGEPDGALQLDSDLTLRDPRTGISRVVARGGVIQGDELRLRNLVVRADPVRTDLLREQVPELPAGAIITGQMLFDGYPSRALRLDGDLALNDPATGISRVGATGAVAYADELRLTAMRLRLHSLQTELVRPWLPELPAGATIAGDMRLDGVPSRALQLDGDLELNDPASGVSRVGATGGIAFGDEIRLTAMQLRLHSLQTELVRPWLPELPAGATIAGDMRLDGVPTRALQLDGDVAVDDPASGVSRVGATGAMAFGNELRFTNMRVRLHELQVDLLRDFTDELPPGGVLTGAFALDGTLRMMQVNGDIAHADPRLGRSDFGLRGGIGFEPEFRFSDLNVRMQPLHMSLVRVFAPDLPIGGTMRGTARLNGSTEAIVATGDVVHVEGAQRSHLIGSVEYTAGTRGWAVVDLQLQPLSLWTVGRFMPAAGLHGSVSGSLRARGRLDDVVLDADLRTADGGVIRADGWLNLAATTPAYDMTLRMTSFDMAAITTRAPATTNLTGRVFGRGTGFELATMRAEIHADLIDSEVNELYADRVLVRTQIQDGLARIDSSFVRLGTAEATMHGSFGLVAGRYGELAYRVVADSLHAFAGDVPGTEAGVSPAFAARDTLQLPRRVPADAPVVPAAPVPRGVGPVAAMPHFAGGARESHTLRVSDITQLVQADAADTAQARVTGHADVLGTDTLAAHAAHPAQQPDRLVADTPADSIPARFAGADTARATGVPGDSLAGRLFAEGTLRGNVSQFDADGRAEVEDLVFRGTRVGSGEVEYTLRDVLTPVADIAVDAEFRDFHAAGMSFDSLAVEGTYRGGDAGVGRAVVVAHQDEDTDYRADVQFSLSLDRSELRLADAAFRFDTVAWQTTQPGVISWGGGEIDVRNLELVSSAGGRVYVHGIVPVEGSGDFDVRVQDLELAQISTILQTEEEFAGVLNLDVRVTGTQANPVVAGTGSLADGVIDGRAVPDIRAVLQYANQRLEADAELTDDGRMLATADASLPIELTLTGALPRLLDGEIRVDVVADSLPAEAFPAFSDQVEDVSGRMTGAVYVRGTFDNPVVDGVMRLDLGTLRVVPLGVRFDDVAGTITLAGNVATVDSIVAFSGGALRIDGEISVASLTDPVFDLTIDADNSRVINTDDAELYLDADIRVEGPLSALRVVGNIHTRSGVIYIPELAELGSSNIVNLDDPGTFKRMGGAFDDERVLHVDTSSPFANAVVEIGVVIERDVWLRSTEANVEIYTPPETGPLQIRMDRAGRDLRIEGSINTDRGDYEFMSRRFRLTRGAITFVGETPINPILQVAAEHEVRVPGREAFQIRVLLGGTVEDLEINLESTSQPPISQTDLLSYLAFGRDASSLLNQQGSALSGDGGAGELVGNVAAIATQQLTAVALEAAVSQVERDVARELQLDVFRITPANLPAEVLTGEFVDVFRSTEIEAGRYVQPRLFVGAQARAGRPGLRLEYRSPRGYEWEAAWQPRFLPVEPTLTDMEPRRAGVLGAFLFRQWRF